MNIDRGRAFSGCISVNWPIPPNQTPCRPDSLPQRSSFSPTTFKREPVFERFHLLHDHPSRWRCDPEWAGAQPAFSSRYDRMQKQIERTHSNQLNWFAG